MQCSIMADLLERSSFSRRYRLFPLLVMPRAKIVEGRIEKIKNNMALVNQASLRDPAKTVSEVVKETIAAVGEKVSIRRFERFKLGEGLEKRSNDFAAEVAQQTQAKAAAPKEAPKEAPKKEEPAKPTVQVRQAS